MKQGETALPPSPRARSDLINKQLREDSSFRVTSETSGFCCLFFCYLSVIPFLFVFLYHAMPTTILLIMSLLALCSFIPCLFHKGQLVIAEPAGPILAATMLACTAVVFFGSMYMYWAHVQPMRALLLAREYRNVYPELPSVAFEDAAFVGFAGNTSVDVTKTVSMASLDSGLNTFCLAPITSGASQRIEFWAVGIDCCGGGKFECDDAGKVGAKNGYVMQNPHDALYELVGKYIAPPIARRDIFLQAIAKAEQTRQLTTGKVPLLVRWTKMTKDEMIEQEVIHIIFQCAFNLVLALGMSLLLTKLVHRFQYLRKVQKVAKDKKKTEKFGAGAAVQNEGNLSARLGDLLGHAEDFGKDVGKVKGMLPPDLLALASPRSGGPRPKLKLRDTFLEGIIAPYTVMMLSVLLTTYSPCWRFGHLLYAPFLTMNGIAILALFATPGKVLTGFFLLLVSISGLYIGHENYTSNMYHYCKVEDRRTYSNVPSEAKSDTYWDAGILKFEERSYLSQDHSVGFLYRDVTYCVAPIFSYESDCTTAPISLAAGIATPASFLQLTSRMHAGSKQVSLDTDLDADPVQCKKVAQKRIDYWAIGTGCCGARKDFNCDGGKDKNAHSGVVVLATGNEEPGDDRDQFFNAIKQSVAAYDLPVPDRPVLIRWGRDAEALQRDWKTRATGVIILTAMIGLLTIMVVSLGGFFYMKNARNSQQKEAGAEREQSQNEDEQARRQEFGPPQSRVQLRV